jgi:GDSL-like Lipase/Acylhydrolase family
VTRLAKLFAISVPAGIIALVALAGAVELWTRLTWDPLKGTPGFFLSDPMRIQRLAPGYSGWFAGVPVKINQLELRDNREYRLAKDPRTFRILFLGDSVTFGHGSVYEHSYPYLFEQRLRAWRADVDWQVWNGAVPGYNTSQELAHLLEVGQAFQPDLVVVGFFENDLVDNFPITEPGPVARMLSATMTFLYRHVYSTELYKRVYLEVAWRISASNSYRLRLEHVGNEERITANVAQVQDLEGQQLTHFDRLTDEQVASVACSGGPRLSPDLVASMERQRGWPDWLAAVRRFQQISRDGIYPIVFFLNVVPLACQNADVFHDGGSADVNRFYLKILGEGTPAVSTYDEFRHLRPSEMPLASGHAIGNSNLVKADVLFRYLRDEVFPHLTGARSGAILRPLPAP